MKLFQKLVYSKDMEDYVSDYTVLFEPNITDKYNFCVFVSNILKLFVALANAIVNCHFSVKKRLFGKETKVIHYQHAF